MKTDRLAAALRLAVCAALVAFAALFSAPAFAQNTDTYFYTPNGGGVNGAVGMCLNAQNKAVPCGAAGVTPSPVTDAPYPYTPLPPGQYTPVSDSAATSLTVPTGATYAVVCVEGTNHRYTWDGTTTPTASVGTLFQTGTCVSLSGAATLANFKIIYVTSGGTFTASYAK